MAMVDVQDRERNDRNVFARSVHSRGVCNDKKSCDERPSRRRSVRSKAQKEIRRSRENVVERAEGRRMTNAKQLAWVAKTRPIILFHLAAYVTMPRETNSETLRDLAFTFPEIPRMFRHADRYRRSRFEHCRLFSSTRCDVPSSKQSAVWRTERLRGATTNESRSYIHSCNVFRVVRA